MYRSSLLVYSGSTSLSETSKLYSIIISNIKKKYEDSGITDDFDWKYEILSTIYDMNEKICANIKYKDDNPQGDRVIIQRSLDELPSPPPPMDLSPPPPPTHESPLLPPPPTHESLLPPTIETSQLPTSETSQLPISETSSQLKYTELKEKHLSHERYIKKERDLLDNYIDYLKIPTYTALSLKTILERS